MKDLTIREKDFQKFLFYKYFMANPKILIITEGKTDSRYIKAALKHYYLKYPTLIKKMEKLLSIISVSLNVQIEFNIFFNMKMVVVLTRLIYLGFLQMTNAIRNLTI